MELVAIDEDKPGEKWLQNFQSKWPGYRSWFLSEGLEARLSAERGRRALQAEMPELVPIYDRFCELVRGDDIACRFLTLYCPPRVISGCSAMIAPGSEPVLIRNYDFKPDFFEATIFCSDWLRTGKVIVTSEAFFGALDGMNDAGLAVALTFGGRSAIGKGFGIPILLRYVLECCVTTNEAVEALTRIPCASVQNVMVLDRSGNHAVVYLSPDREPEVRSAPVTTNHQSAPEWPDSDRLSQTVERAELLQSMYDRPNPSLDDLVNIFHQPPVYRTDFQSGLGTFYTAVFRPQKGTVEYRWPQKSVWHQSFGAFEEGKRALPV